MGTTEGHHPAEDPVHHAAHDHHDAVVTGPDPGPGLHGTGRDLPHLADLALPADLDLLAAVNQKTNHVIGHVIGDVIGLGIGVGVRERRSQRVVPDLLAAVPGGANHGKTEVNLVKSHVRGHVTNQLKDLKKGGTR